VIKSGTPAPSDIRALLLRCPRCGLSIRPRARWLAVEHCPRCLARARLPVRLNRLGTCHGGSLRRARGGEERPAPRSRDRQELVAMSSRQSSRLTDGHREPLRSAPPGPSGRRALHRARRAEHRRVTGALRRRARVGRYRAVARERRCAADACSPARAPRGAASARWWHIGDHLRGGHPDGNRDRGRGRLSSLRRIRDGTRDRSAGGTRPRARPASVAWRYDITVTMTGHERVSRRASGVRSAPGGARLQPRARSIGLKTHG